MNNSNLSHQSAAGSTSIAPGALPWLVPGGPVGIMIIHGFGGSIGDYRPFAEQLSQRGLTVMGVRLAGHGQGLDALRRATISDWQESVRVAVTEFRQQHRQIFILGASFGGALALEYAANHPDHVGGVVAINTPLAYRGGGVFQSLILRILRLFTPYYPKLGLSSTERQRAEEVGSTTAWPIDGILATQNFFGQHLRPALPKITVPVLLMANDHDPLVRGQSLEALFQGLGSTNKQKVIIPGQTHRPFRDIAATKFMAEETVRFIEGLPTKT